MPKLIKPLFIVGGLYDLLIGLAFLAAPYAIYDAFGVRYPNHIGYVQFSATFITIFGLMQLAVGRDPQENKNIIPYAAMVKFAYCAVVGGHYAMGNIPVYPWVPLGITYFSLMLLFIWAYRNIKVIPSNS